MLGQTAIKAKVEETRDQFRTLVWPMWRERLQAVELISVEGSERAFEQRADASGIDAFYARRANGVIIPLASRIEYATSDNRNVSKTLPRRFTIRSQKRNEGGWHSKTELERLMVAASDPISYRYLPFRTFHSFLSRERDEVLFSSAVCTQQLVKYIGQVIDAGRLKEQFTRAGDARFAVFMIDEMIKAGVVVETIP